MFNKKLGISTSIRAWSEEEALARMNWAKNDCHIEVASKSYRPKPIEL